MSVITPLVVPTSNTFAPITGSPVLSIIVPVTWRPCAKATKHNILNDRVANALLASLFKSIMMFFIVIKK